MIFKVFWLNVVASEYWDVDAFSHGNYWDFGITSMPKMIK